MIPYSLWVLLCSWLVCTGWILSLCRELNAGGYLASLTLLALVLGLCWKQFVAHGTRKPQLFFSRILRRFRRPLPLIYLIMLLAALIGGSLYPPTNYDALCYRLPRVLHWWSASQWHWIGGWNGRMDFSATGFEWLMAPLLILFKSDRLIFLINLVSYALLPGLIYSSFVGLGVSRRVAWNWMWILPTAYCFAIQAGSISNDSFAAIYFLSAVAFALRAKRTASFGDAAVAILSAALLTGAKASNLPLLLPLGFVLFPLIRILLQRPFLSVAILLVSVVISFLPMAVINTYHSGDWSGDPRNLEKVKLTNPVAGLVGNSMQIAIGAIAPPLLLNAKSVSACIMELRNKGLMRSLFRDYPRLNLDVGEIPNEESAGLGIGITLLIVLSLGVIILHGGWNVQACLGVIFGLLCWAAFAVYMAKMGSESAARLVASYYPGLLVPLLLMSGQSWIVRSKCWQILAVACQLAIVPALLLSPARPLLPMAFLIRSIEEKYPLGTLGERIKRVYEVYAHRNDTLASLRDEIPSRVEQIYFAGTGNETEYSLWKPLGTRQVIDFTPQHGAALELPHGAWIVGSEEGFVDRFHLNASEWCATSDASIRWEGRVSVFASREPSKWYVISSYPAK